MNLQQKTVSSKITFVGAFLVSFALGFLAVSHFKHTVYGAVFNTSTQTANDQYAVEAPQIAQAQASDDTGGCGCPLCCALN